MIDLDKYFNEGIKVKLFGKAITLLQPTAKQYNQISKLEARFVGLENAEEAYKIRSEITLKILNNNAEGIKFTNEDVDKVPVKLQLAINNKVAGYVYELENDPN
jgi:hypothetical protein